MTMLTVDNVSLCVGEKQVLENISADLRAGELVGLIGPNGAGKSSLLKCILGLHELTSGSVCLGEQNILEIPHRALAKQQAYAAQGAPVHWPLNVEYVVGLGRAVHLNPWQKLGVEDKERVEQTLAMTDTLHLRDRAVTTLSGGERARVLLARALAAGTPLLFADEPIASQDPAHQLQVMEILKNQSLSGQGVMVVLHDLSLARRYCDRLILLHEGRLVGQGEPDKVLDDKNLQEVFGIEASRWENKNRDFLIIEGLSKGAA